MPINSDMSYRIKCYTLFDITKTGITSRTKTSDDVSDWVTKRNTQCNFDTILQIISLRSQPEVVKNPEKISVSDKSIFGFLYNSEKLEHCWVFEFEVQHSSVFDNDIDKLGALYLDCDSVPMIVIGTEGISAFLDATPEFKNIHFEVV